MSVTTLVYVTIAVALLFDVINGFHDAANSIATVVSTRVLSPRLAVLWATVFNFVALFIFIFTYLQNVIQVYAAERVARDLRTKLAAHSEVTILAEAATVRSARVLLARPDYDLVFLDSTTGAFLDDPNDPAATDARKKALLDREHAATAARS